jgi:hypothetical protein
MELLKRILEGGSINEEETYQFRDDVKKYITRQLEPAEVSVLSKVTDDEVDALYQLIFELNRVKSKADRDASSSRLANFQNK